MVTGDFESSLERPGGVAASGAPRPAVAGIVESFGLSALRIMLAVGAAFAGLGLLIAVVERDGAGQVAVGTVSLAAWMAGLRWLRPASIFLRHPGRVAALVAIASAGVAAAGAWNSPYTSEVFVLMAVATVVESSIGVATCVLVAVAGYLGGLVAGGIGPAALFDARHASIVVNNIGDFVLFALVLLIALGACRRVLGSARQILESVRGGGPAVTPALGLALRRADQPPAGCLPPGAAIDIGAVLNERERALLRQLAGGLAPKQVAQQTGTPMATIRSQIAAAKRKTGARTLEQLVGLLTEAELGR